MPNPQTLRRASRGKLGQEWEVPPSKGVAVSQTWPEGQKQELGREGGGEPGLRASHGPGEWCDHPSGNRGCGRNPRSFGFLLLCLPESYQEVGF